MRRWRHAARAVALAACLAVGAGQAVAQGLPAIIDCGGSGEPQIRTTLYFGLSRPNGPAVTELEWQVFLRDEVTPRFPRGLTVWDANGQWRGAANRVEQERSKVLLLVHPDAPESRQAIGEIVASYRRAFQQEAVLWESARVCVAF